MIRKVRKYTDKFKQAAAKLAIKSPSIVQVAKELDVPAATLHKWLHQLKRSSPLKQTDSTRPDIAKLLEKNRRLHKEIAITKEEKEILKKAAAYFAQH